MYPTTNWINYNENTGYFEVNPIMHSEKVGFSDIGYEEAIQMYNRTTCSANVSAPYNGVPIRINIFPFNYGNPVYDSGSDFLYYNYNLETLLLAVNQDSYCHHLGHKINNSPKLKVIFGGIKLYPSASFTISQCPNLEKVLFYFDGNNTVNISDCPAITLKSF